jgi:hypothetical protein
MLISFRSHGRVWLLLKWSVSCYTLTAEVLFEEDEKVLVLNPSVMVEIHFIKYMLIFVPGPLGGNVL